MSHHQSQEKRMRSKAFIIAAVLAVSMVFSSYAAASDGQTAPATTAMPGGRDMMDSMCPMKVQGTAVQAKDVDGGVAFVFTTKTGDVVDLRQRVRHMAQMHGANAAGMMTTTTVSGVHRAPRDVKIRREPMPASEASAEDVEHGARLVIRPKDPAQLPGLRRQVRTLAKSMAHLHGECPEMVVAVEAAPSAPGHTEGGAQHPTPAK